MKTDLLNILQQIDPNKSFRDEDEKRLEKTSQEKIRKEKREKRKDDCGEWSNWYNPHSGKRTGFIFRCGLFRHCETCLERRADEEYELIKTSALEKRMVAKIVTPREATNLIRRVEKTEYIRFPQEDGNDLLLLDETIGVEGVEVDLHWVVRQDWTTILNTPKGRNKSGTMHMPISEDDPKEFSIITTKQFITNANRGDTIRAMEEAEKETADLNPKTPDEVVSALRKRTSLATRKLREQGFHITIYDKRLKLVHALIDWQGCSTSGINRNYTENPTRVSANGRAELSVAHESSRASPPIPN